MLAAGTADLPVAEEAAVTAELSGFAVKRVWDVGVAGLHRLLSHRQLIRDMDVLIVVAGMEGALPSVVAGLSDCPIVAVPTSVGYGASFQGTISPADDAQNSCAAGIGVVNIDNGFGAAVLAGTDFCARLLTSKLNQSTVRTLIEDGEKSWLLSGLWNEDFITSTFCRQASGLLSDSRDGYPTLLIPHS